MIFKALLFLACATCLHADPLPSRVWTSTAGTKLEAEALGVENGTARFKAADGREIPVPLAQLVPADQKILTEAFPQKAMEVPAGEAPGGLPHPQGKMVGPLKSGENSNYFLYLPESLAADTPAPVLFFGGSGGCNAGTLKPLVKAAELTGVILAGSVENSNKMSNPATYENTKASYEDMKSTLPMDAARMIFTGGSGGGARTFYQASMFKDACVGAIPYIGYIPGFGGTDLRWDKQTFFYVMGGARDYNRYPSAQAVEQIGKQAIYRPYPGLHKGPPDDVFEEALIYVYTCDAYLNGNGTAAEKNRFEAKFLNYLKDDLKEKSWTAYFWCDHLLNTCKITGTSAALFRDLHSELAKNPQNEKHLEGRAALRKLAEKEYLSIGGGSKMGHTTEGITKAANKIAEEFAGVPEIAEIAAEMGQKTQ